MSGRSERITIEDVFDVYNRIVESGEKPSIIKIHKILGRGGYATIQKHLRSFFESDTWAEANINKPLSDELPLPQAAREAMKLALKTIWRSAENSANEVLAIRTKAVESQLKSQEKDIELVINTNAQQSAQSEANQEKITGLKANLDTSNKSNGALEEKT